MLTSQNVTTHTRAHTFTHASLPHHAPASTAPTRAQEKLSQLKQKHLKGALPGASGGAASREEEAQQDLVSHYVLRLAYCRTADLRKWFITMECEMFRLKFGTYSAADHVRPRPGWWVADEPGPGRPGRHVACMTCTPMH